MKRLLEICADDATAVRAAVEGGADRVELCAALEVGGLTPSPGLVAFAVSLGATVRALIRPRAGDFVFGEDAERIMRHDISVMLGLGVEGVVLGVARADGTLNLEMLGRLLAVARAGGARGTTLNRVIDLTPDLEQSVDQAAELGFDSVLTSGGAVTAAQGAACLARMVRRAPQTLTLIAGSGVTASTVRSLVSTTGVTAVHASARGDAAAADPRLAQFGLSPTAVRRTDVTVVRAIRHALDAAEH